MAKNDVRFRWTNPRCATLIEAIVALRQDEPKPTIKVSISVSDLPQDGIEEFLRLCADLECDVKVGIVGEYQDGQQMTFWSAPPVSFGRN